MHNALFYLFELYSSNNRHVVVTYYSTDSSNFLRLSNAGCGVIRGGVALEIMVKEADLEQPDRIRSSNMRKHLATMSQVRLSLRIRNSFLVVSYISCSQLEIKLNQW